MEQLYAERLKRYTTAMKNGKPDKIPIRPFVAEFTATYAGYTCQEVTHDYTKAFDAARKCAADFDWDAVVANMVYGWSGLTEAISLDYYAVPGIHIEPDVGFQYIEPPEEQAFMLPEEYDELIEDPTGYLYRVWLPRIARDVVAAIAKSGIPLVCPAEPLCGATSPVTLAANVAVQTVDSLMGVMLAQAVNPGTPVIFGSVATSTDLRDYKYIAGSVEMGLLNAAGAQMAQFYKLPFYATGGMTDSKTLDAQSGYESAITNLLCALSGANFIHDSAGLMEFALTACYEKYVIDNEILGMVMRAVEGIRVDDETLAYDLIKEVGPGGNFVTARHTRHFMRKEHYQPTLSDRNSREKWEERGRKTTREKAAETVKAILESHTAGLPDAVRSRVLSEITGIVA